MWWHTVTRGRGSEGRNWRMEWVASTLHTTSEHGVSSITTADAHTSTASSRLIWRPPRQFKWTRPFRRKTKSGFCACAITFQTHSTALSIALVDTDYEGLSITHIFIFYPFFIIFHLVFYSIYFAVSHRLYLRNPVTWFNPLNSKLNPICHLLVLLGAHPILHISRIRGKLRNINLHHLVQSQWKFDERQTVLKRN